MGTWRAYCEYLETAPVRSRLTQLLDMWENRRRAKLIREQGISEEESLRLGKENAEADMTDRENIHFKYKY